MSSIKSIDYMGLIRSIDILVDLKPLIRFDAAIRERAIT